MLEEMTGCSKCGKKFDGKKGKKKTKKRYSTAPAFVPALKFYETKFNVEYLRPSVFCNGCYQSILYLFKPRRKATSTSSPLPFNTTSVALATATTASDPPSTTTVPNIDTDFSMKEDDGDGDSHASLDDDVNMETDGGALPEDGTNVSHNIEGGMPYTMTGDLEHCANCYRGFRKKFRPPRRKRLSSEPAFIAPLKYFEEENSFTFPRPSVFCDGCYNHIVKLFKSRHEDSGTTKKNTQLFLPVVDSDASTNVVLLNEPSAQKEMVNQTSSDKPADEIPSGPTNLVPDSAPATPMLLTNKTPHRPPPKPETCARCKARFGRFGKDKKSVRTRTFSTAPGLVTPLAYFERRYNVQFPNPSAFCSRCAYLIKTRYRSDRARLAVPVHKEAVNQSSGTFDQCTEIVKVEVNEDDLQKLSNLDIRGKRTRTPFHCILCNNGAPEEGIPLPITELPNPIQFKDPYAEVDNGDFVVMFMLRKMLEIPGSRLQDCLSQFGHPRNWISSCLQCKTLILKAFETQREIQKLEKELRSFQALFKEKVKTSWSDTETNPDTAQNKQPVSTQSRCYVATDEWPEILLENESFDVPVSSPPPSPSVSIKKEFVSSPAAEFSDSERDANELLMETSIAEEIEFSPPSSPLLSVKDENNSSPVEDSDSDYDPNEDTESTPVTEAIQQKSNYKQTFQCKMCPDKQSMHLQGFLQHILYHKRRPFKCKVCGNFFTGEALEFDHFPQPTATGLNAEDSASDHKCCPDTLEPVEFQLHPIWKCKSCPECFHLEEDRNSHFHTTHANASRLQFLFSCRDCPKQYSDFEDFLIHRTLEHPHIAEASCYYCDERFEIPTTNGVSFPDNKSRNDHIREFHKDQHKNAVLPVPECEFCGDQFLAGMPLCAHVESRHRVSAKKKTSCPYCFARRKDYGGVKDHVLQIHNPSREKFVCDECGYSSFAQADLHQHKLAKHGVVTDTKNLKKCNQDGCNFQAYRKQKMTVHMVTSHGMPNLWTCKICGKTFLQKQKLSIHEQIHKNKLKKPFQCELCGNSFAVKNYLYIHMRLSHQNRPFVSTHKKKPPKKRKQMKTESLEAGLHFDHPISNSNPEND